MFLRRTQNFLKSYKLRGVRAFAQSHPRVATPRQFPTTGFEHIPISEKIEEECFPWYTPQSFYPVRIGDVIHSRYQVLYKVGYGTTSTLWMCRDLHSADYVCMKSMVCDYPVQGEIKAYEALSKAAATSTIRGQYFVRSALDHFELKIDDRIYPFLTHEPLGFSIELLVHVYPGNLPTSYIRLLARGMLNALEFIHSARIVHGDILANNILIHIADGSVLNDTEEDEIKHPSRRKMTEHTAIFETRGFMVPASRWLRDRDPFVLCDFGQARVGRDSHTGLIQPAPFRAPEVHLCIPWSTPVDIWNLGCMVWNLMFRNFLFSRTSSSGEKTGDNNQLAWMVAFLGPPPQELLEKSGSHALQFFHKDGTPKVEIPNETLESFLASSMDKQGREMTPQDAEMFLAFLRKTMTWTQETRASASELLSDPWILKQTVDS